MAKPGEEKILTVDDEAILRQSIVAYLEDSGFEVVEGENGRHGLEVFREEKPDLVLTDLQMPEMGGLEFLGHITKESPETPIIVVSGAGGMNDVIEALRLGAWDYITKPITDLAVLEHAVNKSLERSRLIAENKAYGEQIAKTLKTLEEDQQAGRSVQTRILPPEPITVGDYVIDYRVVPSLYLSGDFIDFFKLNDDKVCLYLADVSGHGASSAFVTVLLKSLVGQMFTKFQANNDPLILNPAKMMEYLSKEIYSAKLGKYMTMSYFILDTKTHEITYGVGGHYPNPIIIPKDGEAKFIDGDGYPVGILPSATFKEFKTKIEPGDKLATFSDGVMEVFMHGHEMKEQDAGLLKLLKEKQVNIEEIYQHLDVKVETEQPDDVSILVLSRN